MLFGKKNRDTLPTGHENDPEEEQEKFVDLVRGQYIGPGEIEGLHDCMRRVLKFRQLYGEENATYDAALVRAIETAPEGADLDEIINQVPVSRELIEGWYRIMFDLDGNYS